MTTTAQALASGAFMAAEAIHVTGRRVVATVNWVSNLPAVVNVAYGLFVIGYYMLLEGYLGQTLGKMATGIKVVSAATGEAPGIAAAAIRTLLRIVDGLFSYAVAFITVLASWRRQRLGDMAAHTLSGIPQSAWSFGPYVIGVLALSVLVTPMFNAARGSILVTALFHFQMNGPAWPEAQPWENYLFAAAAVVVALLHRKAMLTRSQAVNEVLVPGAEQPSPEEAHSTATSRSPATGGPWPTAQQSLS